MSTFFGRDCFPSPTRLGGDDLVRLCSRPVSRRVWDYRIQPVLEDWAQQILAERDEWLLFPLD